MASPDQSKFLSVLRATVFEEISKEPNIEPDLKIFIEPKVQCGIGGNAFAHGFDEILETQFRSGSL